MKKGLILAGALGIAALFWWGALNFLTLEDIQRYGSRGVSLTERYPALVIAVLLLCHASGMMLALPTKAIFTLLSGALLGPFIGSVVTELGVFLGTTVLFFVTRHLLRDSVRGRLGAMGEKIEQRLSSRPVRALIGLRLFITLPFAPITMAAALSQMRYRHFIMGTVIGDIPVVVAYTIAGKQLFLLTSVSDALDPWTIVALAGAGLFVLVTALLGRQKERVVPGS